MITSNIICGQPTKGSGSFFKAQNPSTQTELIGNFEVATLGNVESAIQEALVAFQIFKNTSGIKRAEFLRSIANEIEALGDVLIHRAMAESGLPEARFVGERGRTCGQLRMFAKLIEEGSWVEAIIDKASPDRKPIPRVDIRNMLQALGPVTIFGASNFPLAFSTAGGDSASALAAGCPIIVKAHPAHPGTNALVSGAIVKALEKCKLPLGIFSTLYDDRYAIGNALVRHPGMAAIGFTGSEAGGIALMKLASERESPIPVYAEMGSTNPVFILSEKLKLESESLSKLIANSVNMAVGQFCTNPGLLFIKKESGFDKLVNNLEAEFEKLRPFTMLSSGIYSNYMDKRNSTLSTEGVKAIHAKESDNSLKAPPAIAIVDFDTFQKNQNLHNEVFGPFTMIVACKQKEDLKELARGMKGQLTATFIGTENDLEANADLIDIVKDKVGRIVFNGVPTGVEVGDAMHHGGPFPASSNGKYTSVGTGAIKRFVRPIAFQDCPDSLLPNALKNGNPLGIWRRVNGEFTKS